MKRKLLFIFLAGASLFSSNIFANTPTNQTLVGYWENWYSTPVRLTDINSNYNVINIAFANIAADGTVSFLLDGSPYPQMANAEATFKSDIKTLQAKGVKVILSLGGQNGYYPVNSKAQENNFVSSLANVIRTYNFDGVDYDFESGLSTANNTYLLSATQRLKDEFAGQGKTLLFTLAPETIDVYWGIYPYGKYDLLIKSDVIDWVQVQLYNSGCMPGIKPGSQCYVQGTEDFIVSQADSTIQTWMKNGIKNAAKKYVAGFPATVNAAGGGYVDPAIINKAFTCLKTQTQCGSYIPTQTYPDLGSVMTWSINYDAKSGYAFAQGVKQ